VTASKPPVANQSAARGTDAVRRGRSAFGTGACLTLIAIYLVLQAALGSQAGDRLAGAVTPVRGIFRFTSTSWSTFAGDGFNSVTDGGANTNYFAGQRAAGLAGMIYLDAYDNSSCRQTMTDTQIRQIVQTNVTGGYAGAVYQVGDEPTTNGCNANAVYTHMTSVIHTADASAKTWVADDQFNDPSTSHWPAGLPMARSVDILAFDIYPCQAGPCRYDMIDLAIQRIHSVGLGNWEFILQDFGPCQSWRAPTAQEVREQFQHWQGAGALGYWVYAYDRDPTPCPGDVAGDAVLRQINALAVNATSTPPTTTPLATSSPSSAATPTVMKSPSAKPSASTKTPVVDTSPADSLGSQPPSTAGWVEALALTLIGVGLVMALAAFGLNYVRRRQGK
jgi:hypothetical protein